MCGAAQCNRKNEDPTDWVSSMVTIIKLSGKLCICIDPRPHDMNRAIQREYYLTRTN